MPECYTNTYHYFTSDVAFINNSVLITLYMKIDSVYGKRIEIMLIIAKICLYRGTFITV